VFLSPTSISFPACADLGLHMAAQMRRNGSILHVRRSGSAVQYDGMENSLVALGQDLINDCD
jgi:hypothetical protein